MIRKYLIASAAILCGTVAFAHKAGAQAVPVDEVVPFAGNIGSFCTFSNTQPGTLAQFSPNDPWVAGGGGIPAISEGTAGQTTVNCTSGGSLTVGIPNQITAPAGFTAPDLISVVYDGTNFTRAGNNIGSTSWDKPTTPLTIPAAADVDLQVGMFAGDNTFGGGSVPTGTYEYEVTLTATPN